MKKKIAVVFVTKQSLDYYKCCGFFEDVSKSYDVEILKLDSFNTELEQEFKEVNLPSLDLGGWIDLYKYLKEKASLHYNDKRFSNKNHHLYAKFNNAKTFVNKLKFSIINIASFFYANEKSIEKLERKRALLVAETKCFKELLVHFKANKPDFIYLTHQTTSHTYCVSQVAKVLNIPTISLIYSWDNVVKGNKQVMADYYFVWSRYMKDEMLQYYENEVSEENVFVVGTPQFHQYFQEDIFIEKELFFKAYQIPKKDFYICFSGNFTSIGQDDPAYLADLAAVVTAYNSKNEKQFHILLRANPADYNQGFIKVVKENAAVITDVKTSWESTGVALPLNESKMPLAILKATIEYSDAMLNVGSTMALDATILNKLAYYLDYKIENGSDKFNIDEIYKFIHFKSLKELDNPVKHLNSKEDLKIILEDLVDENSTRLSQQKVWAEKIVAHPLNEVSKRMLSAFDKISEKCI